MRIRREPKPEALPKSEGVVALKPEDPAPVQLPAVYYGDRDGGDVVPKVYRQTKEMREQSGGQLGVERGHTKQESPRQQRINEEAKAQTEKLNRTGYPWR